jgi:hypothetical protein
MPSETQIVANRLNARKSTGLRSDGCAASHLCVLRLVRHSLATADADHRLTLLVAPSCPAILSAIPSGIALATTEALATAEALAKADGQKKGEFPPNKPNSQPHLNNIKSTT